MSKGRFRRLGLFYLFALGCIALTIALSQLFIQSYIGDQQFDSRTINLAGRQRMLSQKITKSVLSITYNENQKEDKSVASLKKDLDLFTQSNNGLLHGNRELGLDERNSEAVKDLFDLLKPHYDSIRIHALGLINKLETGNENYQTHVETILLAEPNFLKGMDKIVFQYDLEATQKVAQLQRFEYFLFGISLLIILLEIIFIFQPLAKRINATMVDLYESEEFSKQVANDLNRLYEELGKSYQDLEAVNIEPESTTVFARMDKKGKFSFFSEKLRELIGVMGSRVPKTLDKLFEGSGYREGFTSRILDIVNEGKTWSGELKLVTEEGDFCWIEAFMIPVKGSADIKFIARDVTNLKEAMMRSREINKERIDKLVKEQNYRSSLILQGQEEERKRLSQELHDGVGQMLSAMKLSLEAISPSDAKHMKVRLNDSRDLMKSIIQEVRRVSFNLTPSSLDDFGLVAAVRKFCREINAVSKAEIVFNNETNFVNRLDSTVETSLYRIIQEAVNNALKYAQANKIEIVFSHRLDTLTIIIRDDGAGFDYDHVKGSGHFEKAGHGLFNMKERAAYIGAQFELRTQVQVGTEVLINLSLNEYDKSSIS